MGIQTTAKVHIHSIMCNEILTDRSKRTKIVVKWEISISRKVKLAVFHTDRQSLVFMVIVCLEG